MMIFGSHGVQGDPATAQGSRPLKQLPNQTADAALPRSHSVATRTIVRTTPDAAPPASGATFPAESDTFSATATPAAGPLLPGLGSLNLDRPAPVGTSRRTTLNASVLT